MSTVVSSIFKLLDMGLSLFWMMGIGLQKRLASFERFTQSNSAMFPRRRVCGSMDKENQEAWTLGIEALRAWALFALVKPSLEVFRSSTFRVQDADAATTRR